MPSSSSSFLSPSAHLVLDQLWDAVYIVDNNKKILAWNRAAVELTGYTVEEVLGRECGPEVVGHMHDKVLLCDLLCPLCKTLQDGDLREAQVTFRHKLGHRIPIYVRVLPLRDPASGTIAGAIEIFRGVATAASEAFSHYDQLEQMAYKDALTGIANRRYGDLTLTHWLSAFARDNWSFGVLLMDVDRFKGINDTHGHQVGDLVLRAVSSSLKHNLRPSDFLCRWGGDELMVLLRGVSLDAVREKAGKLCGVIENTRVQGHPLLRLSVSIGGAVPLPGETEQDLLIRVDKNLYASKENGRNQATVE